MTGLVALLTQVTYCGDKEKVVGEEGEGIDV